MADVWSAVKAESFVMTFKNTQSIKVFNAMNKYYAEISDELRWVSLASFI